MPPITREDVCEFTFLRCGVVSGFILRPDTGHTGWGFSVWSETPEGNHFHAHREGMKTERGALRACARKITAVVSGARKPEAPEENE